jgi:hypothetical protein
LWQQKKIVISKKIIMKYLIPFTLLFFVSCVKEDILLPKQTEVVSTPPKQTEVAYQPIQFDEVDKFLSTPASGAKLIVPVVIINYIPSKDKGKTLDQTTFPFRNDRGNFDPNLPVSEYKKWLLSNDIRTKASIEEGSKFRNYNNAATPYIGIKVIKYINVYEIAKIPRNMPPEVFATDSTEGYYPDYHDLFKKIGLDTLVNNYGVKEIWFNRKSLAVPESNMSSPTSGDVSNAYYGSEQYGLVNAIQQNDLPIYKKTYVVYSHFVHFGYDNNLHIRGHQIERQMGHINNSMWNIFVGSLTANGRPKGCGNTHFPVNASRAYDYDNSTPFNSEITNWNPNGSAVTTTVSSSSWKKGVTINYVMPTSTYKSETSRNVVGNDPQGGWMIYWFQSIPGENNKIPYGNRQLTNWWDIYYNWDDAIINKKNLF